MPTYDASVTLRDAYNRKSTKRFQVDALDHAAAVTAVNALCADLAALTLAEILKYTVGLETLYSDSAGAGANLDAGITLSVETTEGNGAYLKVPAPVTGVVNADGTVDIENSLVTDYLANWLSGGFLISDGETVATLLSGKLDR